jgi:predicted nucleic acid-binding protein
VTLLDAYALIALLLGEPAAEEVKGVLRSGACGVPVLNLAESVDVCGRVHLLPPREVRSALEPLLDAHVDVVHPREEDAWRAAELRIRYYDREGRALSLADCFLIAAARGDDSIATADPAVAETARLEGIEVAALPDQSGRLP